MLLTRRNFLQESIVIPASGKLNLESRGVRSALIRSGRALLIGVSDYQPATRWAQLPGVRRNVDMLAEYLRPHFGEVLVADDLSATGILRAIEQFFLGTSVNVEDRLFLFYGGHGFYNELDDTATGYITGNDTFSLSIKDDSYKTAIPINSVNKLIQESKAKHIFCLFDSCQSGVVFNSTGALPELSALTTRERFNLPSRAYLSSGDTTDRIPEPSPVPTFFLQGLAGDAPTGRDDGLISAHELGSFVHKMSVKMYADSATPFWPRFGSLVEGPANRGEFFFARSISGHPPPIPESTVLKIPFDVPRRTYSSATFLLFFDWDRALITTRGNRILWEASMQALDYYDLDQLKGIKVSGHSDNSTSPAHARRESSNRAEMAVQAILGFKLPKNAVSWQAFGATRLLVPTANGVREPQNRRVEIVLQT